jgi:hypothetical protein
MFKRHLDEIREAMRAAMRTPACLRGRHAECPHLFGFGAGFAPLTLRLEAGASLCTCDCHVSCPATGDERTASRPAGTTGKAWHDSCTCPGAAAERAKWEQAGVDLTENVWDLARQRQQARREAFNAAKAQAAGKSHEQIKEIYLAELRARHQEVPSSETLDAKVAAIGGNPLPSFLIAGRATVGLVKFIRGARHP